METGRTAARPDRARHRERRRARHLQEPGRHHPVQQRRRGGHIGIKQPINAYSRAEQHRADAIGMSGLLVKSTVIMKENLAEMASRGVAERWPVLLGGAALTRAYVEDELGDVPRRRCTTPGTPSRGCP